MKRILTTFKRDADTDPETPDSRILSATRSFCTSEHTNPGEEVLYLPTIVDVAESSPSSAALAANTIRKFLDAKQKPHVQYNAVMLTRILADNPGPTFTRNLSDPKFVTAVKGLLRGGRDPSVRQILVETLEYFDEKGDRSEGLQGLRKVWAKEKVGLSEVSEVRRAQYVPHSAGRGGGGDGGLPGMEELVARISEAQMSAKLLEQVLQSTPSNEVPSSDLILEFADRCRVAARSVQSYISATPPPDEDTLTTLIMTNDMLTTAISKHALTVKEALERGDVHQTRNSRIVDVGDVDLPAASVSPPEEGEITSSPRKKEKEREMDEVLDGPVNPVASGPMAYRY